MYEGWCQSNLASNGTVPYLTPESEKYLVSWRGNPVARCEATALAVGSVVMRQRGELEEVRGLRERVEVCSWTGSPMDWLSGGHLGSVLLHQLEWGCQCWTA